MDRIKFHFQTFLVLTLQLLGIEYLSCYPKKLLLHMLEPILLNLVLALFFINIKGVMNLFPTIRIKI